MPAPRLLPRLSLVGLLLAVVGMPAAAEDDVYFSELPMVASLSRLPQRLEDAPGSVTVIERDVIKASGARDLSDVFRLVPGFQTFPNNTDSARVTYHGLTDEDYSPRVQVLVDGRSLYSPLFRNGVNWALIPVALEDIERIEVVRGSNAVSYGTSAFLGVINIVTVDPSLTRGVSVSTAYGNQGVRDYTLRSGGKLGEMGAYRFTYQQRSDNGLTDRYDWQDANDSRLLDLRVDLQATPYDALELNLGRAEAKSIFGRASVVGGVPSGVGKLDDPFRDFDQSNTHLQALWRRSLMSGGEFRLRYAFSEDWATDAHQELKTGVFANNGVSMPVLMQVDAYGGRSRTHLIEAQHVFSPLDDMRAVWGGSWRSDRLTTPDYLYGQGEVSRRVAHLFGNLEWKPVRWFTGNAGAALEHDSLGGMHESPRVSGNFHLNSENTLRLAWAKAYRTGSIVDYLGDRRYLPYAMANGTPIAVGSIYRRRFLGDPEMAAEKLETLEAGYLGDWKSLHMSLDVRAFLEKIPNRLMSIQRTLPASLCDVRDLNGSCTTTGADYMTAIQSVRIRGIEYQWRWQPFDETRIVASQAFMHIDADFLPGLNFSTQDQIKLSLLTQRSAPTHSSSILLMQKLPFGLDFSLAGYWLGSSRWSQNTEVPAYRRLDARLGWPFNLGGQRGEVALTVQSLDGSHIEYKGWNGSPGDASFYAARVVERRSWVSLRLDF